MSRPIMRGVVHPPAVLGRVELPPPAVLAALLQVQVVTRQIIMFTGRARPPTLGPAMASSVPPLLLHSPTSPTGRRRTCSTSGAHYTTAGYAGRIGLSKKQNFCIVDRGDLGDGAEGDVLAVHGEEELPGIRRAPQHRVLPPGAGVGAGASAKCKCRCSAGENLNP